LCSIRDPRAVEPLIQLLTNFDVFVREAAARALGLVLAKDRVLLSISDTGVGFDREAIRGKRGLGIISMEERVRLVVGELIIRSKPGDGVRVVVEVPLPEAGS
jgi:signal transduction histidine kinase